jgi:hypothetical protein
MVPAGLRHGLPDVRCVHFTRVHGPGYGRDALIWDALRVFGGRRIQ